MLAEFRSTGTGQKLFDAAIGDQPAYLWVLSTNMRARHFYEKNGFVARRRRAHRAVPRRGDPRGSVRPLGQTTHRREREPEERAAAALHLGADGIATAASSGVIQVSSSASWRGSQVPVTGTT